ncbi:MAG: phosphoadenosine phosphosulfate reductase family protein, partial [Solobacterium sp.]|nr:phosphoadenosine phosphosulfate reductase family protein [Solobacterium sp.]
MWCKKCNIETDEPICPICGSETVEDLPTDVFWCSTCHTPVIQNNRQADRGICPVCRNKLKYMATDIRPVFPEERLLFELVTGREPNSLVDQSVWASNNRYFVEGKPISVSNNVYEQVNVDQIIKGLKDNSEGNSYDGFNQYVSKFIDANSQRLDYLKDEANEFIHNAVEKFDEEHIVLSFSGGKDSTATADLVVKALSNPSLVHIFGDTTLEFPLTVEYAKRFRENHPQAIFIVARNNEQNFMDVCEDIGPPARLMRWCCSMFKTGPITRAVNSLYRNQRILTFYGIRKFESVSRSKYNRIEDDAESVKIQQQTVASPIFFWKDIDVWLYILSEGIDFNDAYRLGYDRVG